MKKRGRPTIKSVADARNAAALEQWRAQVAKVWTGRPFKEWTGKTPEAMPPDSVRERIVFVWEKKCQATGQDLAGRRPDFDHVFPVADGGANREANLRPVLPASHREKTIEENKGRAKAKRQSAASLGLKTSAGPPIKSRGFTPTKPQDRATSRVEKLAGLGPGNLARRFGIATEGE